MRSTNSGRLGFKGTGTRAIAAASGTAISSIILPFRGKQGLYLAAADHIAAAIAEQLGPALAAVIADEPASAKEAAARLVQLLDGYAMLMLSPQTEQWSCFIIREQQPTEAFDRLYTGAMQPVVAAFNHLATLARPDLGLREIRRMGILCYGARR